LQRCLCVERAYRAWWRRASEKSSEKWCGVIYERCYRGTRRHAALRALYTADVQPLCTHTPHAVAASIWQSAAANICVLVALAGAYGVAAAHQSYGCTAFANWRLRCTVAAANDAYAHSVCGAMCFVGYHFAVSAVAALVLLVGAYVRTGTGAD